MKREGEEKAAESGDRRPENGGERMKKVPGEYAGRRRQLWREEEKNEAQINGRIF